MTCTAIDRELLIAEAIQILFLEDLGTPLVEDLGQPEIIRWKDEDDR